MTTKHLLAGVLAALLLGACSGSGDGAGAKASSSASPSATPHPREAVVEEIAALPEVDLDDIDVPKATEGFSQEETDFYAADVKDLVEDSLVNDRWWDAEPDLELVRAFMDQLPPGTSDSYLSDDYAKSTAPIAQFMVSVFAEDAQPVSAPRIVKAAWDIEPGVRDDGSPYQRVKLQALALYEVGAKDDPRPVLVRREISLAGSNAFAPGSWPGLGNYTTVAGVESCELYRDGVYAPDVKPDQDIEPYESFLADATSEDYIVLEDADNAERPSPEESRDQACDDQQSS